VGLNAESRGYIESIYSGGILGLSTRTQDEVWDFFEKLGCDTSAFEQARGTLENLIHGESVFHNNPYQQDHFIDSHDSFYSYVPPILCYYCEFFYHDACNYPFHDYVDATCARLGKMINELTDKMIETMKERIAEYSYCFNHNRKNYNGPNSSSGFPKPKVSLYDVLSSPILLGPICMMLCLCLA